MNLLARVQDNYIKRYRYAFTLTQDYSPVNGLP